jgi:hypothetical protein
MWGMQILLVVATRRSVDKCVHNERIVATDFEDRLAERS